MQNLFICSKCNYRSCQKQNKSFFSPSKPKAPLSACGPEKLWATVISSRLHIKELEEHLQKLEGEMQKDRIGISESFGKNILSIMGEQSLESTLHMKFFWQEQMKLLQSTKMCGRYHRQIIRFVFSIHSKSPSAYRELQDSGALALPSERVLRDCKNCFKPKAGINKKNVESLREKTSFFYQGKDM